MKNKKLFAILTLVCFMMTLMPVAAFAADTDLSYSASVIQTKDADASANVKDDVKIVFGLQCKDGTDYVGTTVAYVWATETENGTVPTDALTSADANGIVTVEATTGVEKTVSFLRAGSYYLHASFEMPAFENGKISAAKELARTASKNKVEITNKASDPESTYYAALNNGELVAGNKTIGAMTIVPNNIANDATVKFVLKETGKADKKLVNKTVAIDVNSANIRVNKTSATTDVLGQVEFKVAGSREGVYFVYLTVDGVEFKVQVNCGNTVATYIETEDQPKAPIALFETTNGDVTFKVTDINGNIVKDAKAADPQGMAGIFGVDPKNVAKTKYLFFVEKPAKTTLKNTDLSLKYDAEAQVYNLVVEGTLDAEGTYTVQAILDNGAFATATFEVKRFGTPQTLYIKCARNVELGKYMLPKLKYVDENGVEKYAKDAKLAGTGYAIYSLSPEMTNPAKAEYTMVVKTDEKYVGSVINLVASSERYNLVGTADIKIGAVATDIAFEDKTLAVNANNDVKWNVVDADGNNVKLDTTTTRTISYVVLDKPEGAKVSVYDKTKTSFDGEGKMAVTCDKVGKVTIQAIAQVRVQVATQDTLGAQQTRYYTGTKIFAVGTEGVGKVVVMSIGSNEIVINDKTGTIDAAPIVQNNRTFVPFRALAEAFGAEVAYDEATQAVTAKLNGAEVVMTIGSATYTVNGVEATMDVAPFIASDRTYVPVRFAAEAFGIKVIPTYNPDGTTADILFNL